MHLCIPDPFLTPFPFRSGTSVPVVPLEYFCSLFAWVWMYWEMMGEDMDLVKEYAEHKTEHAFSELVSRHIDPVYSVAFRYTQNAHLAEEITQAVFILLAQKASSLGPKTILSAWLCHAARNIAIRTSTVQYRRQKREHEAYMQSITEKTDSEPNAWNTIVPFLETALGQLKAREYDAIVLRFFNHKSFKEVAMALGTSEDGARMQVNRSLEKMRTFFLKRGVTLSIAVIAVAIAENSVQAAPAALAKSVTTAALSKGALASTSSLTSIKIKGALKIMAWSKAKVTAVATVAVLLTAGTATVATTSVRHHWENARWDEIATVMKDKNDRATWKLPRTLSVRKSKLEKTFNYDFTQWDANNKVLGLAVPASGLLGHAYNISRTRIANQELLPPGKYDFISSGSARPQRALQGEISRQFGIVAAKEMIETNVLVLSVARTDASGVKTSAGGPWRFSVSPGRWTFADVPIQGLAQEVEHSLNVPVVDQTGLTNLYDMELIWGDGGWTPDPDKLKQSLLDQLGLQLKPETQTIEMLVLKKAR